jgi:methionyl-tRNA synthetase
MHPFYITTPIYYVNDRPHIGHCYTTLVADAAARFQRLVQGDPDGVFLLTGTDEHADKVVTSAAKHGVTPLEWADKNAEEFQKAFAFMGCTHDDFIRTTQDRHKTKVLEYVRELQAKGAIYLGDYSGWWDASQEEYLTETVAKESPKGPYTSPVTGVPLVKRTEKNYFFKLSAFEAKLREHIDKNPGFIQPESRRNEVLGRLKQGLQDVPVSRAVTNDPTSQWGIRMPEDAGHRIYVWIDALFNYLSAVDTPQRGKLWPPAVHVLAKDILWFHAVIWPAMLMALGRDLPGIVYAHSYWVRDGMKMSKSLGNFVTIEVLEAYANKFGLDAVRWYLLTQGPLGNTDADFSHGKFVEVYNADLANGFGNCASRVGNMIDKYFGGKLPAMSVPRGTPHAGTDFSKVCGDAASAAINGMKNSFDVGGMLTQGINIVRAVDQYINTTAPFKIAKTVETNPGAKDELGTILYNCAEALRVASLLLSPALVVKIPEFWTAWSCAPAPGATLADLTIFGGPHALKPGQGVGKGEILFMRADVKDAPPG